MSEQAHHSLLPRGTKTWQKGDSKTTVHLVLAYEELAGSAIKCAIHTTEHISDHRAIETVFDIEPPDQPPENRLLFKNVPWNSIRSRIAASLRTVQVGGSVQQQTDRPIDDSGAVSSPHALTTKAKQSPYAKRSWTHSHMSSPDDYK